MAAGKFIDREANPKPPDRLARNRRVVFERTDALVRCVLGRLLPVEVTAVLCAAEVGRAGPCRSGSFIRSFLSDLKRPGQLRRADTLTVVRYGFETPGCACSGGQG